MFNLIVIISWFKNLTMVVFFKYELFWRHSVWRKFKMVCNTHLHQQQQPTNCENGDDAQLIFTWEWSSEVFSREEKEKISFTAVFRVTWSELLIFTWEFPRNHFHENFREIDFTEFFFGPDSLKAENKVEQICRSVVHSYTHWFFREGLGFEQNTLRFSFIHTFPNQIRYPHTHNHTDISYIGNTM